MNTVTSGRERLERVLIELSRRSRPRGAGNGRRPAAARPAPGLAAPVEPARQAEGAVQAAPSAPALPAALADLAERLERIEEKLADLSRPVRPLPASREIFSEWVRLRHWEEIRFGEFLRLRRAGLL